MTRDSWSFPPEVFFIENHDNNPRLISPRAFSSFFSFFPLLPHTFSGHCSLRGSGASLASSFSTCRITHYPRLQPDRRMSCGVKHNRRRSPVLPLLAVRRQSNEVPVVCACESKGLGWLALSLSTCDSFRVIKL